MDVRSEAAVTLRYAGVALRFVAFVVDAVVGRPRGRRSNDAGVAPACSEPSC
jgi:hypothetical protein